MRFAPPTSSLGDRNFNARSDGSEYGGDRFMEYFLNCEFKGENIGYELVDLGEGSDKRP